MSGVESVPLQKHDASSLGSRGVLKERSDKAHVSKYGLMNYGAVKTGTGNQRNRPCPCGSNLKYKKCCLLKEAGYAKLQGENRWEKAARVHNPVFQILPSFNGETR